jgi:serine/threonine-protein kinase HSL1 (negative regulator of Swe1 kinase)
MNEEKYFYLALKKYSEGQLDSMDYSPARTGLVISASDYHHSQIIRPSSQKRAHSRSNSQFSVYHEEHIISKHSFFEEDENRFDPFGIERDQSSITNGSHISSQLPAIRVTKASVRTGNQRNSLRVETSRRRGSLRNSLFGRGSSSNTSGRLSLGSRRTQSTGSIRQSVSPTPIIVRSGKKHKRNVSFDIRRRNASHSVTSGALTASMSPERTSSGLPLPSSPPTGAFTPIKPSYFSGPTPRSRRLKEFDLEARKVSNELGKVCEEAFFGTSLSEMSMLSTDSHSELSPADTPPSTMSNPSSANKSEHAGLVDKSILDRPLPPSPTGVETPNSYTTREIQQFRDRLALRYAQDGASNHKYFNEILSQLDSLVEPVGSGKVEPHKRGGNSLHHTSDLNLLQPIPEEGRGEDSSSAESNLAGQPKIGAQKHNNIVGRNGTIRVVEPSSPGSPTPWVPLKIRKSSGASQRSNATIVRRPGVALNCE